jgi:hypothetical protein
VQRDRELSELVASSVKHSACATRTTRKEAHRRKEGSQSHSEEECASNSEDASGDSQEGGHTKAAASPSESEESSSESNPSSSSSGSSASPKRTVKLVSFEPNSPAKKTKVSGETLDSLPSASRTEAISAPPVPPLIQEVLSLPNPYDV